MSKKLPQDGFHLLFLLVIMVALGVIGAAGYLVISKSKHKATSEVRWSYDSKKDAWYVSAGKAPTCKEPLVFGYTPVPLAEATSVGFPGTYRGKSYKVHGTFALAKSSEVKLPADATLSGLARYYEGDPAEIQYAVSFEMDCGISFYFDHLYTLSPKLQQLANKLPEPKVNDTRVNPNDAPPRIKLKAGDIVATATGAHKSTRYGIDFGVVDYRQRNKISYNAQWRALHSSYKSSEWYGTCWFNMLPGADASKAKELSVVQADTRKVAKFVSDYCDNADYTTPDLFGGKPVDSY
ncbi:MAG TPA: hypothetical protein VLF62_02435 [Candidatus Saccharimonadales bacterium]|nr:hypothetical protein [Candidatus Saccharimonadales bacterium]